MLAIHNRPRTVGNVLRYNESEMRCDLLSCGIWTPRIFELNSKSQLNYQRPTIWILKSAVLWLSCSARIPTYNHPSNVRFRKAGYLAIDRICDYYYSIQDRPVCSQVRSLSAL